MIANPLNTPATLHIFADLKALNNSLNHFYEPVQGLMGETARNFYDDFE